MKTNAKAKKQRPKTLVGSLTEAHAAWLHRQAARHGFTVSMPGRDGGSRGRNKNQPSLAMCFSLDNAGRGRRHA